MSLPRPIFEGDLYLVTRRTTGRRFFLKPSQKLNNKIEYCIAVAAMRHRIRIHAVTVMSNHWHCVASDPHGVMPEFLRDVHSWIAKSLNSTIGRWENLWSSAQTSLVRTKGDTNVVARIVYTMANPVASGLVAHGKSWPGLRSHWPQRRRPVARPSFFREAGTMPEHALLELHRPPGFESISDALLESILRNAIEEREQYHRDAFMGLGRRFLGRRSVLQQSVYDTSRSREERRKLSPRVAERDRWRRLEVLQRLRDFLDRYRRALAMYRAGFRNVVFPAGTYKMRVNAAVLCSAN